MALLHTRPLVVLTGLLAALLLAGCGAGGTDTTASDPGVRVASATDVADLLTDEPERVVIDVRTPEEFAAGHLEDAVLVDYNAPDFAERIAEFVPDGDYVIYCRSGNRSAGAREVMTDQGFTDVVDVEGGIIAWDQAGLPVVAG